jgi:hypothetical protein
VLIASPRVRIPYDVYARFPIYIFIMVMYWHRIVVPCPVRAAAGKRRPVSDQGVQNNSTRLSDAPRSVPDQPAHAAWIYYDYHFIYPLYQLPTELRT